MHRPLRITLFLLLAASAATAHADPITSGQFGSFAGWSGSIVDSSTGDSLPVDPATDPHFNLIGGGFASLTNDFDFYEVVLFQDFILPDDTLTIAFDFAWLLTAGDPFFPDFIQAKLIDPVTRAFLIDLFPLSLDTSAPSASGSIFEDISFLAGQTVSLEFILQDGDFNEADRFDIGNILIATAAVEVAEPATILLFLAGLAGLLIAGGRRRNREENM